MIKRLLFIFLFFPCIHHTQTDSVERRYYRDGRLKFTAAWKGNDTLLFKGYHKNGQLKDSVRLYWTGRREIPLGTEKTYYKNGQLRSIIYYKNAFGEYTAYQYHKNGLLKRFVQKPTGLDKSYNKKGEQVSEADFHESKEVFVSRGFRKGRHLKNPNYKTRITLKKAWLTGTEKRQRLSTGVLVSMNLTSDTSLITHCQIEGFSNDSIYFSKFHYNQNYERGSGLPMLEFDSSFAIGFNQLKTIYYSKHKNRKRTFGAMCAYLAGIDFVFFPIIPFAIVSVGMANPSEILVGYAVFFAAPGTLFYLLGKHLYKTTVPKKYDLARYKIRVKT
jgi:hypothetical protein